MCVCVCLSKHPCMHLRVLIFFSTSFLIFTWATELCFSICLWTISQRLLWLKMWFCPVLLPSCPLPPSPAGRIEILLVCLCGMRDENDSVDRKKDDKRGGGVGVSLLKKGQRMGNRWEMKHIRTPWARSRGCDLSSHAVVGERGDRWTRRERVPERQSRGSRQKTLFCYFFL